MEKLSKASRRDPIRISVDLPGPIPNLLLQFLLRLEMCWKHLNVNLNKGQAVSSIPQSLLLKCCRAPFFGASSVFYKLKRSASYRHQI